MRTEQIQEGLHVATEMALYFQKDQRIHLMLLHVIIGNNLSSEYLHGARFVHIFWSLVEVRNLGWLMQRPCPVHFKDSCTPIHCPWGLRAE